MTAWLVLDMDDGVLRREPTRKAALTWWMQFTDTSKVVERYKYGPGAYSYTTGDNGGGTDGDDCFIEREDIVRNGNQGWDVTQQPLYPHDGSRRFERVERVGES